MRIEIPATKDTPATSSRTPLKQRAHEIESKTETALLALLWVSRGECGGRANARGALRGGALLRARPAQAAGAWACLRPTP